MVWAPSASGRFREGPKIGQIGLGLAGGQKCSEMIIPKKEIIIDLEPARTGEFRLLGPVGFWTSPKFAHHDHDRIKVLFGRKKQRR